jgi:hypothetical protein
MLIGSAAGKGACVYDMCEPDVRMCAWHGSASVSSHMQNVLSAAT